MFQRVLPLFVLAALLTMWVGCDLLTPPSAKLVGKWRIDVERSKQESKTSEMVAMMANLFPAETEYRSDGVASAQVRSFFGQRSLNGAWSMENEAGQQGTLKVQWEGTPLPQTLNIEFLDADHFRAVAAAPGGSSVAIIFSRVKAAKS